MSMMIALLLAGQFSVTIPKPSVSVPSVSVPSASVPSVSLPVNVTTRTATTTTTATPLTQSQQRDQLIMDSQSLLTKARAQLAAMPAPTPGATIVAAIVPGAATVPTRADLDTQITTTASAYDTMARFSRSDTVGMQGAMGRSAKSNADLTAMMKKITDATPAK